MQEVVEKVDRYFEDIYYENGIATLETEEITIDIVRENVDYPAVFVNKSDYNFVVYTEKDDEVYSVETYSFTEEVFEDAMRMILESYDRYISENVQN